MPVLAGAYGHQSAAPSCFDNVKVLKTDLRDDLSPVALRCLQTDYYG